MPQPKEYSVHHWLTHYIIEAHTVHVDLKLKLKFNSHLNTRILKGLVEPFHRKISLLNHHHLYSINYFLFVIILEPETKEWMHKAPYQGPIICSYSLICNAPLQTSHPCLSVVGGGFKSSSVWLALYPREVQMHVSCNTFSREHEEQGPGINSPLGSVEMKLEQVDWRVM